MKKILCLSIFVLGLVIIFDDFPNKMKRAPTSIYTQMKASDYYETRLKEYNFKNEADKSEFALELQKFRTNLEDFKLQAIDGPSNLINLAKLTGLIGIIVGIIYLLASIIVFFNMKWGRELLIAGLAGILFYSLFKYFYITNWSDIYFLQWLSVAKLSVLGGWEHGSYEAIALAEKNKNFYDCMTVWIFWSAIFLSLPSVLLWQVRKERA